MMTVALTVDSQWEEDTHQKGKSCCCRCCGCCVAGHSAAFSACVGTACTQAHAEALALKAALEARQLTVFLSDVSPGHDLQQVIAHALVKCRLALILASKTYGRQV